MRQWKRTIQTLYTFFFSFSEAGRVRPEFSVPYNVSGDRVSACVSMPLPSRTIRGKKTQRPPYERKILARIQHGNVHRRRQCTACNSSATDKNDYKSWDIVSARQNDAVTNGVTGQSDGRSEMFDPWLRLSRVAAVCFEMFLWMRAVLRWHYASFGSPMFHSIFGIAAAMSFVSAPHWNEYHVR